MPEDDVTEFVYQVRSHHPAPAAGGDEKSWFLFYKWSDGIGSTWVPAPPGIQPGDQLWFAVDGEVLGHVTVTRVEENFHADRLEAYYNADHRTEVKGLVYSDETGRANPSSFSPST